MSIEVGESGWAARALEGQPPEVRQRYREVPDYLDMVLRGIDDDAKINALRAMVNLGVSPSDDINVIIALLGYFVALGREIPLGMREVVAVMELRLNSFVEQTGEFDVRAKALLEGVLDETRRHAIEMGRVGVQTAGVEEMEKHRFRLTMLTKDVVEGLRVDLAAEAKKSTSAIAVRKQSILGGIVGAALITIGVLGGWLFSSWHAPVPPSEAIYVRQGQTYVRMWNDPSMPADVRAWIRRWSSQSR